MLLDVHVRGRGRVKWEEERLESSYGDFCSTLRTAVAVLESNQFSFCFCSYFSLEWTKMTGIKFQSIVMSLLKATNVI